ncbi:hypothetical protein [Variovorax paradoxus]|jgi:hypothetical protein|uniref:hypothetical protein n=1 Tax=Variovorax paradoxus TaxID=34073 RepID=UPI00155E2C8E
MYLLNESLDNYVAQRARELAGARRDVAFAVRHFLLHKSCCGGFRHPWQSVTWTARAA